MTASLMATVVFLLAGLAISSIIIYLVTKAFGEREGIETALAAALVGAIIYALAFFFLGQGLYAGLIAGFVWLLALGSLYNMGWLKALGVALIVWVVAMFTGLFLPTAFGPL